jgi:peptide/nickel transport system ATP-binding protein
LSEGRERLIEVKGLRKYFQTKRGLLHAVDGVDFAIGKGETLGLVGESGCGKSTTGRVLIRLLEATAGQVLYRGKDVLKFGRREMKAFRRSTAIVFQDPYSSLDPRWTVAELIAEPLRVGGDGAKGPALDRRVGELMDTVGIARRLGNAYPHELDGGRRQRVGIARALALNPEFIVQDEPVSALDVCIQAQFLNLMKSLQQQFGLTYLFISHNLSVVKHVSDRIAVMYLGQIIEQADRNRLFRNPLHPYTQALLSAIPRPKVGLRRERRILEGDVPSPINPGRGCRFAGRCPFRQEQCLQVDPVLLEIEPGHLVSCHFAGLQPSLLAANHGNPVH